MTKDEALKLAMDWFCCYLDKSMSRNNEETLAEETVTAIKEALAQPEFVTHAVENAEDWSEWVCPDPQSYLMKCCGCGLVHEMQFKVVRYKSENEREECDPVNDPNLQAVFRMRRSEQWSPKDTAYRPGGLAQPEQEPVAFSCFRCVTPKKCSIHGCCPNTWPAETQAQPEQEPVAKKHEPTIDLDKYAGTYGGYTSPPHRKPLTDEEILAVARNHYNPHQRAEISFARAIEAAHGIKE